MSWFSSKKEASTPLEEDFGLDLDVPFNEEDLNDQSLLDELRELQVGSKVEPSTKNPKNVKKSVEPEVNVDDIIQKVKLEADNEPVVEFNEDDMNDPDLLQELQQVAPESAASSDKHDSPSTPNDLSTNLSVGNGGIEVALDSKLNSTDAAQLQKYIQVEKMKALNKKRAGDKAGALESLKVAKEMEKRLFELQTPAPITTDHPTAIIEVVKSSGLIPDSPVSAILPTGYDLTLFNARMVEFKKVALAAKRNNDLSKAREMLSIAKSIQKAIDTVSDGLPLDNFVLPAPPIIDIPSVPTPAQEQASVNETPTVIASKNVESLEDSKKTTPKPTQDLTQENYGSTNNLISHLITTLEAQISTCTKLSAQYFTSNQKELALEYHKKKKGFLQDKQTLNAMKSITLDSNSLPFRFVYNEQSYQMNQTFTDIALDQVEISIEKATDIFVKGIQELESLVCFDFGWPSNSAGTLSEGKGETMTVKGLHPDYKYKTLVKIERTKPFQRFLERKRATFELFYLQKSLFGLVASRVCFGKASVKLEDLLSKCEIHQVLPLMDPSNPRKATGSTLEIKIRMRAPLVKPDVVKVSEQWLQVIFGESAVVQPSSTTIIPRNTTEINAKHNSTGLAPTSTKRKSPASSPKPVLKDPVSPSNVDPDIDDLERSFLMPENITSNAVLEHEHKLVIQQIAQGNKSEELQDLKTSYEIKMNMLVTSIQLGTLDMPGYLAMVKDSIAKTKSIALTFKKANRVDLAKKALVRVKIMTSEVDEVESQ